MRSGDASRCCLFAVFAAALVACGGGGGGGNNNPPPPPLALNITTTSLVAGVVGAPYSQTVAATGGTAPRTFSISAGDLPAGLALAANGVISGTPAGGPGTSDFTITVTDSASPAVTDAQALNIQVNAAAAGRNDSIADATPIGNGTHSASISPAGDPSGTFDPDEDYYSVTTTAAFDRHSGHRRPGQRQPGRHGDRDRQRIGTQLSDLHPAGLYVALRE